ncbi:MAG TPA: hypothetical protein VN376_06390 [Longilinea sp.]|nr:hypothetical protein [Longilinea sp.]
MAKKWFSILLIVMICLSGCDVLIPTTPTPTSTPSPKPVETLTNTAAAPTLTITPTETITPTKSAPTETPYTPTTPLTDYSSAAYLDDRSTPAALMLSYANAINRHEYVRAYSYWGDPVDMIGSLDGFTAYFVNVESMEILFGTIGGEGAAGSVYYPMTLLFKYTTTSATVDRYSACYLVRMSQPGNYGAPPITPMHIENGYSEMVLSGFTDADALNNACAGSDFGGPSINSGPASLESLSDLSNANYIDNRSGAVEVVSSLFNSINRHEYVRAYSYWENPVTALGSYDAYEAGFSDTGPITATFGTPIFDGAAGQWYYSVPVAMVVQGVTSATRTYVGCYVLHISNPGFQGTYPFVPLMIREGHFSEVPNGTNTAPLLATACN